ncbi:MAG TPA: PHP domain-containing protein [Candidatus Flavonifractor merdigallinarum]|uniref:PHP domain-containing protein n=1 Tax=Candidatus Flavonifractor merdigallinarum TaxID=2838589 RepID=A0A9D1YDL3_9FIRM|nr:PHP domain-containing protein [Candidatus Flavonifractor merdigallinarum]
MFLDIHLHESTYSPDGRMTLAELVEEARQVGLDGVCITDHDSMGLAEYASRYAREVDYPIFVGAEYYSREGDILVFGIDALPEELRLPAQDIIDYVNERGGACIAAHPFRNNNRGLEEHLLTVRGLTGIEVLNGSTSPEANRKALQYAQRLGIQGVGASDAHNVIQLGRYATWLPQPVGTMEEFVAALRAQQAKPAILSGFRVAETF